MEFGFVIVVAIAWMILNAVREAMKQIPGGKPPAGSRRPPLEDSGNFADASPGLRDLLEALEKARAPAARGPVKAQPPRRPPPVEEAEFVEDTTSLETAPRRIAREEIDLDSASEEAIRKRREAVAFRDRPRTPADHAAFDARVRQEPADATRVASAAATPSLRQALIWREILGPPPSLRDD